jgi:hypothetical protein
VPYTRDRRRISRANGTDIMTPTPPGTGPGGYDPDLVRPPWQVPDGTGLVVLVEGSASSNWADRLLARHGDGLLLVWVPAGVEPAARAVTTVDLPGVRAVVLALPGAEVRLLGLALRWAVHLSGVRVDGCGPGRCVTSTTPPAVPPGTVRVPHLVTARRPDGTVVDVVVWELMPAVRAGSWLGAPLPDRSFVEAHLDRLLRLRAAARTGRFPPTAAGSRLARLLAGRALSIRFVYRRPDLFRVLLTGPDHVPPPPDAGGTPPGAGATGQGRS